MLIGILGGNANTRRLLTLIIQYLVYDYKLKQGTDDSTKYGFPAKIFISEAINHPDYSLDNQSQWFRQSFKKKLHSFVASTLNLPLPLNPETTLQPHWNRFFYRDARGRKHRTEREEIDGDFYDKEPMTIEAMIKELHEVLCRDIHSNFWVNAFYSDYKPRGTNEIGFFEEHYEGIGKIEVVPNPLLHDDAWPNWIIRDITEVNEADSIIKHYGKIFRLPKRDESYQLIDEYIATENIEAQTLETAIEEVRDYLETWHII